MSLASKKPSKSAITSSMPLNARVSIELMDAVKAAANTSGLSLSDLMRVALEREISFRSGAKFKRVVTLADIDARLEKIHDLQASTLVYQRANADLESGHLAFKKEVLTCLYAVTQVLGIDRANNFFRAK